MLLGKICQELCKLGYEADLRENRIIAGADNIFLSITFDDDKAFLIISINFPMGKVVRKLVMDVHNKRERKIAEEIDSIVRSMLIGVENKNKEYLQRLERYLAAGGYKIQKGKNQIIAKKGKVSCLISMDRFGWINLDIGDESLRLLPDNSPLTIYHLIEKLQPRYGFSQNRIQ